MRERAAIELTELRDTIDPGLIRVGGDAIELVTSGMYVSPVTIFREYVQNAADAIDHARSAGVLSRQRPGRVAITLDHQTRGITIRDNGIGVPVADAVSTLLAIGGSQKRGTTARGFRGVGRLAGLGYCGALEFRTKVRDEHKVAVVRWDCRELHKSLSGGMKDGDLRSIVARVASVSFEPVTGDDHYFEVRLSDILRLQGDVLLNEAAIKAHLAQVAPLDFGSHFSFADQIRDELRPYMGGQPVELFVSGEQIWRPHRDELILPATNRRLKLNDLEIVKFADVDGEVGAIGWLAHHDYVRSISTAFGVRGLRARIGNIQVGDESLFDSVFKEARFNGWTVGEINILDRRIVPNARRDNFVVNHHYYNLLAQVSSLAGRLSQRCRLSSVTRNASLGIERVVSEGKKVLKQQKKLDRADASRLRAAILRARPRLKSVSDASQRQLLASDLDKLEKRLFQLAQRRRSAVVAFDEAKRVIARAIPNRELAAAILRQLEKLTG